MIAVAFLNTIRLIKKSSLNNPVSN